MYTVVSEHVFPWLRGHSSSHSTTVRYVNIADPQRRAAIALHPINDWLQRQGATA